MSSSRVVTSSHSFQPQNGSFKPCVYVASLIFRPSLETRTTGSRNKTKILACYLPINLGSGWYETVCQDKMPKFIRETHPGLVFTHVDQCVGLNPACHIIGAHSCMHLSLSPCLVVKICWARTFWDEHMLVPWWRNLLLLPASTMSPFVLNFGDHCTSVCVLYWATSCNPFHFAFLLAHMCVQSQYRCIS